MGVLGVGVPSLAQATLMPSTAITTRQTPSVVKKAIDLRLLLAIADSGSLSRAAESFPLALSAASNRLRLLEMKPGCVVMTGILLAQMRVGDIVEQEK